VVAVKQMPARERPRERLERHGPEALMTHELLAIVLGEGVRRRNVLELANDLLADVGGTGGLARASREQLCRQKGVGRSRAGRIIAAVELGRRVQLPEIDERPFVTSSREAAALLIPEFGACRVERFGVVLLDVKRRVLRTAVLSSGGSDSTCVDVREVFRVALADGVHAVVAFHNHPSGDPLPSAEDIALTQRLHAAGELMDIQMLDHVIVAHDRYYSFKESALPPAAEPVRKRKRAM
jgi:DNA repair protein RadC